MILSTHTNNKSDTLSNNVAMGNIKNDIRKIPICIPTIQKSIPISSGTTSTKNILWLEMKQKNQVAQV